MKKVLVLTTVASMIEVSNMENIALLQEMGYEVHVACNFKKGNTYTLDQVEEFKKRLESINVSYHHMDFARNLVHIKDHINSYKNLVRIIKENKYEFVHCQTPIGGAIGRLACKATNTKCIYTAHGFHFYKGAPLVNWLVFYTAEKILSRYTDILITINKDDYNLAKKKFTKTNVLYVPGVGIDIEKFSLDKADRAIKRKELGLNDDNIMLLSVGELNVNKNHEVVVKALGELQNPKIKYYICGRGPCQEKLEKLIKKYGLEENVFLLGFRNDISQLCKATDIYMFPSFREGLSIALMEAMASGVPSIVSDIRGNRDLINNDVGMYVDPVNVNEWKDALEKMCLCDRQKYSINNRERVKGFSKEVVLKEMKKIYNAFDEVA